MPVVAAEGKKADPTGTWRWTVEFSDRKVEQTLKLKIDGDRLTGTISGGGKGEANETRIEDGKFKDGEVTFTVTRERGGAKTVNKFKAKVEGDALKGEYQTERDGQTRKREFEARRVKDDKQ